MNKGFKMIIIIHKVFTFEKNREIILLVRIGEFFQLILYRLVFKKRVYSRGLHIKAFRRGFQAKLPDRSASRACGSGFSCRGVIVGWLCTITIAIGGVRIAVVIVV